MDFTWDNPATIQNRSVFIEIINKNGWTELQQAQLRLCKLGLGSVIFIFEVVFIFEVIFIFQVVIISEFVFIFVVVLIFEVFFIFEVIFIF